MSDALTVNGLVEQRRQLAGRLGMQFAGKRDVYDAAGYDVEIDFDQYLARYERQDIAARIVDAPAEKTWEQPPEILDGRDESEASPDTDFAKAWRELVSIDDVGEELEDRRTIWHYLQRVDKLAGIGRYGAMLVGINDGRPLDQPLAKGKVSGQAGFLYLSVFDEKGATIDKLDDDPASKRFGLPAVYQLDLGTTLQGEGVGRKKVHWSRVVHVADGMQQDEIFGKPRMRASWNRLLDLEKIMAGSGEAAWKLVYKGLILSTRDGYRLSNDEVTERKIEEYIHGLTRFLQLEGMEATIAGGEVVDPTGLVQLEVSLISAATSIPQRILLGSERGELASTQDESNWDDYIAGRQHSFAEPVILRPLINRLVYAGVLPAPKSGGYVVRWPSLGMADAEKDARVAKTYAEALQVAATGTDRAIDVAKFAEVFVPMLPEQAVIERQTAMPFGFPPGQRPTGANPNAPAADETDEADETGEDEEVMTANAVPFRGEAWAGYP